MKSWPKDPAEPISFEPAIDALKRALYHLYYLAPRHPFVAYDGYDIGQAERVVCVDPEWALSKEGVASIREKSGRSPVDTILHTAFLLGMEQGRRCMRRDNAIAVSVARTLRESCDADSRGLVDILLRALTS